jgi:1,2-phenylacetyl-CoA epoxidase catalytic subunit
MFTSGEQRARQNHNLKISNKSYDMVVGFKYFGTNLTKIEFKKVKQSRYSPGAAQRVPGS